MYFNNEFDMNNILLDIREIDSILIWIHNKTAKSINWELMMSCSDYFHWKTKWQKIIVNENRQNKEDIKNN